MRPTKKELAQEFLRGRNCAQCTLGEYAGEAGFDREETDRFAAAFGGGMELGQTCGAVTGGLMALGLLCEEKEALMEKSAAFRKAFLARHGTCMCKELLGMDVSQPEVRAQARESGILIERCPVYVETALEILDEILDL